MTSTDISLSTIFNSAYEITLKNENNNFDYKALIPFSGIILSEIIELSSRLATAYVLFNSGQPNYVNSYVLDNFGNTQKAFIGAAISVAATSLKQLCYHNLITQYLTPNAYLNNINIWKESHDNLANIAQGMHEHDYKNVTLKEFIENNIDAETISNAIIQSEAGTYQVGNNLQGLLGGGVKIFTALYSAYKSSEFYTIAYIGAFSAIEWLVSLEMSKKFKDVKDKAIEMKNIPFEIQTSLLFNKTTEFKQKIEEIKNAEEKVGELKALMSVFTGAHDRFKSGLIIHTLNTITNPTVPKHMKEAKIFEEHTFWLDWFGVNNFRIIDLIYRFTRMHEAYEEIKAHKKIDIKAAHKICEDFFDDNKNPLSLPREEFLEEVSNQHKFMQYLGGICDQLEKDI